MVLCVNRITWSSINVVDIRIIIWGADRIGWINRTDVTVEIFAALVGRIVIGTDSYILVCFSISEVNRLIGIIVIIVFRGCSTAGVKANAAAGTRVTRSIDPEGHIIPFIGMVLCVYWVSASRCSQLLGWNTIRTCVSVAICTGIEIVISACGSCESDLRIIALTSIIVVADYIPIDVSQP